MIIANKNICFYSQLFIWDIILLGLSNSIWQKVKVKNILIVGRALKGVLNKMSYYDWSPFPQILKKLHLYRAILRGFSCCLLDVPSQFLHCASILSRRIIYMSTGVCWQPWKSLQTHHAEPSRRSSCWMCKQAASVLHTFYKLTSSKYFIYRNRYF